MDFTTAHIFRTLVAITTILLAFTSQSNARFYQNPPDTTRLPDTLRYPISDRYGDPYTNPNRNTFDLKDTAFIKQNVEYDPLTGEYYIIEKIGGKNYRTPVSFNRDEFLRLQGKKDENAYFRKRADMLSEMNRRLFKPKFNTSKSWFNRIVGVGKIDIKPSGYVDLLAGYQGQNIKNPTLPERARRNGGLDFNMNAQLQVDANIGDKLKLPINYNTLANFEFENQLNLNYQGKDDEIIKQFQLGNVNFTSKGTLIPGAQSLFGIKTQLQFGKLFVTGVLANQRAQRQSLDMQGGSAVQAFSLKADEYEENRHFLLAHYFRNRYNEAMSQLPVVNSNVQILRMEVWVTNRMGIDTNVRDVVALMNLGEGAVAGNPNALPFNRVNNIYDNILANPNARNSTLVQSVLTGQGLIAVQDFEKTFARKLDPRDYYFNPQIGFLSLQQPLQPDEVLGVAFQYTHNGNVYQVGEFSQDVPPDTSGTTQRVLFLKLLKATSQRTNLPIWDLMMKNVYSVGYGQLERADFKLDLLYEEPSLGEKRYLPPDPVLSEHRGKPLISLVNLDRLNNQNDPVFDGSGKAAGDGVFDFIEGFTVISSMSRIIFPVLEPFGHDLDYVYGNQADRDKYLYYPLYDTIKAIAQTYANLNRFEINGKSKTSSTGDYQLGFNIPRGSVTVTANGQTLQENIDYEINYDLGTLRVINQAIINSGVPVNIQYENQAAFGIQQRNYMGLRLDYFANKKLTLGGTIARLGERPFFVKQGYGDDPIRNTMYGLDADYRSEWPRLTKWLNKLPFYNSQEVSSISAYAEAAMLQPGHAPQIGKGSAGQVYIDDFEGTRSGIDLRFPLISWNMSSVPQNNGLFPEATLTNDLASGYNRAKLAWYNIEPVLQERNNNNNPYQSNPAELSKPETRQVLQREIFPQRTTDFGQGLLTTFDLAFYPTEKGPYNFDVTPSPYSAGIDPNGLLLNPKKRWGGIMRNIDQTDFETSNIEFIEFWMQDPFVTNTGTGGKLYFNLGTLSEDILKDGKRQYENGLPTPTNNAQVDNNSVWGKTPSNPLQITNAFSNEPSDRQYQDVGFDGLTDDEEKTKFSTYVASLPPPAQAKAANDPSADNFKPYRDASYDTPGIGILDRYKNINSPHGNSPISDNNSQFVNAFTQYPDAEELNRDNTLSESEEYFQYKVDIQPNMQVGTNFITDKREVEYSPVDGSPTRRETWYLFRIPVAEYESKVGNIPDFKSVRFIRMFVTDFDKQVVMRFGKLELIRNQWRKFQYEIDTTGQYKNLDPNSTVEFSTLAVNLEENDRREPIRYVSPPGIDRQQELSNNNVQLFLNEQSLSVKLCNLPQGESRGVFKTMNMDMRQYGKMRMFIHAEGTQSSDGIQDNSLTAIVRIGNDFQGNYYEVRIPLKKTNWNETDSLRIWPELNNLDFDLQELTRLKSRRNQLGTTSGYYSETLPDGRKYAVLGNPNLGEVKGMLLSVENTNLAPACAEVWFNELRFSNLDEKGGWAALGRVDIKLADLGNITLAGSAKSKGFGTLEQRVNERSREDLYTFDLSANIDAGKLLPKQLGVQIPVYAGISRITSTPEYDPYDLDIKLEDKLDNTPTKQVKDSIRKNAQDITTVKTVNFTNVKKIKTDGKQPKIWSVTNFDLNYSYLQTTQHNPLIQTYEMRRTRGALGYNYAPQPKYLEPFKQLIKSKSKWLGLIKDINFNYVPSQLSFRADVFRQFGATRPRNVGGGPYEIPETYDKYFTFDRYYILQWALTRSISLDFTATNNARVDEPFGRIDTKEKKDSVRKNIFKGGRNTQYAQQATLTYNVPMQKIPLLDWTTLRASYSAQYNWLAASNSPLARGLGNTLSNTQSRTINGELNFDQLYNKSRFLRAVNSAPSGNKKARDSTGVKEPKQAVEKTAKTKFEIPDSLKAKMTAKELRKAKREARRKEKEERRKLREQRKNQLPEVGGAMRLIGSLATSLKRVGIQYNEDLGTTLPGYMDSTRVLGANIKSGNPGFAFIFGYQPDTNWINHIGNKGLLSTDTLVSAMIQQRYNQRLNITAQVSPFRDLTIDLNLDKSFSKQYSELYKDTSKFDNVVLTRLNPYAMGSFSISYISYQTMFTKFDPNVISETFKEFESNRSFLSQRLKELNPYAGSNPTDPDGYVQGYGRYAQDVVIPAFLAAYGKKSPGSVKLIKNSNPGIRSNPFSGFLPKPNWTITYNGLSRISGLENIFSNVNIKHGYHSTLSMNSFNTALLFQDPFRVSYPFFRDAQTGNYIPFFLIPNITIQESFDPLIEVDVTFTNQLSVRTEFRKTRSLSLSLIDYQLAENRSTEMTFGFNWRKKGLPLLKNLKIGKKGMKLDNDVTFRFDFSVRDDATANSKLDQGTSFGTAGQKVIRFAPSIDYILNNRVSLKLYFEQNRNIPKISNAFPITNTRGGLQVRISLAQ